MAKKKRTPLMSLPAWIHNDNSEQRFEDVRNSLYLAANVCGWMAENGTCTPKTVLEKLANVFDQAAKDFEAFVAQLPPEIQFWYVGQPIRVEVDKVVDRTGGAR